MVSSLESFAPKSAPAPDASAALHADYMNTTRAGLTSRPAEVALAAPSSTAAAADIPSAVVMPSEAPAAAPGGQPAELPTPIQDAINQGSAVRFSSAGENQGAGRQPDYFMNQDGQLEKNPAAQPSADGSINIQIQSGQQEGNKSLRDAIVHESDMQKAAAQDMIRLYQKNHPGQPVPSWMTDLASAKPNVPDFVPFAPAPNQPVAAAPENGFVNRNVGQGGGTGGFAGNGGFDGGGNFRGTGGAGDGTLNTGATDAKGQPMGPGETVQAKQIYDYMTDKYQLSAAAASGILGNMMTESSLKTNAHNATEGAIGLCQWEGPRRTQLEHFAASEGKPVTDWHVQVDFMMHELKGSESGAFARLEHAQTPTQAAAIFDQYFERSSGEARGQRMANADHIYHNVAMANPHTPTSTTPSTAPMA